MCPAEYIGPIMTLGTERRGIYKNMRFLDTVRVELDWEFPLGEIILDFFDKMKTVSRGYASLDYEMLEYRRGVIWCASTCSSTATRSTRSR
jgi:GTP-binding protein LepA